MINTTYWQLRKNWHTPAQYALRMAKAYDTLIDAGCQIAFGSEMESAISVFGEPCPYRNCNNPRCSYAHYDPNAEMMVVMWRDEYGNTLASLGMVEDDGKYGHHGYGWYCAMELATEALVELERNSVVA